MGRGRSHATSRPEHLVFVLTPYHPTPLIGVGRGGVGVGGDGCSEETTERARRGASARSDRGREENLTNAEIAAGRRVPVSPASADPAPPPQPSPTCAGMRRREREGARLPRGAVDRQDRRRPTRSFVGTRKRAASLSRMLRLPGFAALEQRSAGQPRWRDDGSCWRSAADSPSPRPSPIQGPSRGGPGERYASACLFALDLPRFEVGLDETCTVTAHPPIV
jgi:hypothetical protein